jgi:SAM-dependent methyltransferase
MEDDRRRWEERYATRGDDGTRPASAFLQQHIQRIPAGRVLDLACGDGRNALYLARHGFVVDAIDIARAGLRRAQAICRREQLPIHFIQADLDGICLPHERYDLALNVRFLDRTLWPSLKHCVRPLGLVLFETFTIDQAAIGHPQNPKYLLGRGELLRTFDDFDVLTYEEGLFETETGPAHLARLLARRSSSAMGGGQSAVGNRRA